MDLRRTIARAAALLVAMTATATAIAAPQAAAQKGPGPDACNAVPCNDERLFIFRAGYTPATDLRRALGRPPADRNGSRKGFVAHHIIPIVGNLKSVEGLTVQELQRRAIWCGLHPNSRANGVYLRGPSRLYGSPGYRALGSPANKRLYYRSARGPYYVTSILRRLNTVGSQGKGKCEGNERALFFKRLASAKLDIIKGRLRVR